MTRRRGPDGGGEGGAKATDDAPGRHRLEPAGIQVGAAGRRQSTCSGADEWGGRPGWRAERRASAAEGCEDHGAGRVGRPMSPTATPRAWRGARMIAIVGLFSGLRQE